MDRLLGRLHLTRRIRIAVNYFLAVLVTVVMMSSYEILFNSSRSYLVGLFPVIVCSLWLGIGEGIASLLVTMVYFGFLLPQSPAKQSVLTFLFLLEGAVVLWLAWKREQSARKRERELVNLKKAQAKLLEQGDVDRQTTEQLRQSNQIMLDSLERILEDYENRG